MVIPLLSDIAAIVEYIYRMGQRVKDKQKAVLAAEERREDVLKETRKIY